MQLKREWNRLRKQEKIVLIFLLIACIVLPIYSFIASQNEPTTIIHTISECQHEECVDVCNNLKLLYGEDSTVKYAFNKTETCSFPITLLINEEKIELWVSVRPVQLNDNVNQPEMITSIIGLIVVSIVFVIFVMTCVFMYLFKRRSSVVLATITKVSETEHYNRDTRKFTTFYVCEYEYRDREYKSYTDQKETLTHYSVGDKFEVIYINRWPNKAIPKNLFAVLQFIPWVVGIILVVMLCIYGPTLLKLLTICF